MSLIADLKKTAGDCWDGNASMVGDTAGILAACAGKIPGVGEFMPDFKETSETVNGWFGIDGNEQGEGNYGNKIGTVLGGVAGLIGGPGGAAIGASMGSAAGGWIASLLGDDSNMTTATKSTPSRPSAPAPAGPRNNDWLY